MELHPHFQQPELFDYMVSKGIAPIGFSPLGSPGRPERDRTPQDTSPMEDPVIVEIARAHGIHPAAGCLTWGVPRGEVVRPFSGNPEKMLSNLSAVADGKPLSSAEMEAISGIDRRCRLVKGQVFTWAGATWEDLWDEDGTIKK
jgi:diketogulonate reductase-like aldo/keto reductase